MILAYVFAVLRSAIYGTTVYFTGSLTETVDVLDILALRFLMSFVVLWILKTTRILKLNVRTRDIFRKQNRSSYMRSLLLASLFEPVLYMLFETIGISATTGITAGVILALSPFSSCVCEALILKEKTTWLHKLFLAIRVAGVCYIALNTRSTEGKDTAYGIAFLVLTVISGSLFSVFSRHSSAAFSSMERTYITAAVGMLAFNGVNVVRHFIQGDILSYFDPYFDPANMLGFFVLAVVSTIVATGLNNYALARAHPSTLAAFAGVSTLVTVTIGVCTGEAFLPFHAIGLTLIVIGMVGVAYLGLRGDHTI